MHKGAVVPLIVILSVAIGGLLYLYGGAAFNPAFETLPGGVKQRASFTILTQGQNADLIDTRINYRIQNQEQLASLWSMIYTTNGPAVPPVDFSSKEVLAVFDGSHSTSGYDIRVTDVKEVNSKRVISIVHVEPGESCDPPSKQTSPFVLVVVDKTVLGLDHQDTVETSHCQ